MLPWGGLKQTPEVVDPKQEEEEEAGLPAREPQRCPEGGGGVEADGQPEQDWFPQPMMTAPASQLSRGSMAFGFG